MQNKSKIWFDKILPFSPVVQQLTCIRKHSGTIQYCPSVTQNFKIKNNNILSSTIIQRIDRTNVVILIRGLGKQTFILSTRRGRVCRGAMIPAKMTSQPPDLQNHLPTPGNRLPASVTSPSLPPFCLHAPHFGFKKKYLAFISTKNLFFQKFST